MEAHRVLPKLLLIQGASDFPAKLLPGKPKSLEDKNSVVLAAIKNRFVSLKTTLHSRFHTINIDTSPSKNISWLLVATQIIWFGVGLSVIYDLAETIFHWHHLMAVAIYSGLVILSTWIGIRAIMILSLLTLPAILSMVYFSWAQPLMGDGMLALWTQMISKKSLEYSSYLLIMMGGFGCVHTSRHSNKKLNVGAMIACVGVLVGNGLMLLLGRQSGETQMLLILAQQWPSILALCMLGLICKRVARASLKSERGLGFTLSTFQLRALVLVFGTLGSVLCNWAASIVGDWLQHVSFYLPWIALLFMGRLLPHSAMKSEQSVLTEQTSLLD